MITTLIDTFPDTLITLLAVVGVVLIALVLVLAISITAAALASRVNRSIRDADTLSDLLPSKKQVAALIGQIIVWIWRNKGR